MTVGKAIYYLLSNYTDLTDIVSTRIFPEVAEQDSALPFVIYSVISNEPSDTHEGPSKLDIAQVDVVMYNTDYSELVDMGVYVRAALDRVTGTYNGVGVQSVQYTSEIIDFEDYSRAYVLTQSYDVRINRDGFEIAQGSPVTGANIIDLADTPSAYGTTGQALVMNAEGDALEWGDAASALGSLTDVNLDDPQDHEALVYDQDTATWINGASTKIGIRVINTGLPLLRGCPVRATGVQGDQIIVAPFNASQHDAKTFIGLLSDDLPNGATGYARQTGTIYNLNTIAFEIGDILYPAGGLFISNGFSSMTDEVPEAPAAKIPCAIVLRKHANTGRVYVRTWTPSRKIEDMDDVGPLILPQFRDGKSLVWNIDKWISGSPKLNMSELLDVQTYNPVTIPNKQTLRWSSLELEWQVIPEVGGLPTTPDVITYFLGRYNDEASTARQAADATLTIEHYLSVQADGHGEEISAQTDTPTSGNKIVRKIWHKAVSFEDSDVSTWTLVHTFADDTAYADTTATFDALLTAATYGSIPFTLAQTWEDVPAFTGLLETYSGAAAAYSLRLLDSTYTGDAIRVRRASDNAEQDIGFVDNELDTSALATFCAGTDGFVKTWYDQSGDANDGVQFVTGSQPKIYDASTGVVLKNGKPAVSLNGSSQFLRSIAKDASLSGQTLVFVTHTNSTATQQRIWTAPNASVPVVRMESGNFIFTDYETSPIIVSESSITATTDQCLLFCAVNDNDKATKIWKDGTAGTDGTTLTKPLQVLATAETDIKLGTRRDITSNFWDGTIQEVVFYPSDQSANRAGIETNINTAFSIYGQSPTGFLADYPGAAAAYSLRQLISTATYAVAVRRDSDDAVLPIGFVNGELDTTTLAAFCSGANGYVVVWFDQSGEGNHATQTTTGSQPKIYDASTGVELENGVAALRFDGTNDGLNCSTNLRASGGASTVITVSNIAVDAGAQNLFSFYKIQRCLLTTTTSNYSLISISTNDAADEYVRFLAANVSSQVLNFATWDGSSQFSGVDDTQLAQDGTLQTQTLGAAAFGVTASGTNSIGYRHDISAQYCAGTIQEVIIYTADKSANRAAIQSNINDHYTIY